MRDNLQAVYTSYEEAIEEAERIKRSDNAGSLVTKVQKSPYGGGFIVRTFPASFLVRPRLSQMVRSVEYEAL